MENKKIVQLLAKYWHICEIESGNVLLIHSSLKRLLLEVYKNHGYMVTPQPIYDSLQLTLGDDGSLVLSLFNFDFPNTGFFDIDRFFKKVTICHFIDQRFRGKSYGTKMIKLLLDTNIRPIKAIVRNFNSSSLKVFQDNSFSMQEEQLKNEKVYVFYKLQL